MDERSSERDVAERARQAAGDAGFGAWECSLRVNRRHDKDGLLVGTILLLAGCTPLGMLLILKSPLVAQVMLGAAGMIFLCGGLAYFLKPYRHWRTGRGLVHFFEDGAVLERTKGRIFALPYDSTAVDYVTWEERSQGTFQCTHFGITLPDDQRVMLDAEAGRELRDLAFIAQRWGLPAEPRALDKEPLPARKLW